MSTVVGEQGLSALADPTRSRIIRLMRNSEDGRVLVGEVATTLGLRQPTVSHHMGVLFEHSLVQREPEGRRVWYSLNPLWEDRIVALMGVTGQQLEQPETLEKIANTLTERYAGEFSRETVLRYLTESYALLAEREQTPLLASRAVEFASQRLDGLSRGSERDSTPQVLFVCVQNAGRSQMAAGILRHLAGSRVVVRTAGSEPASDLRSSIVTALDELGVSLGGEFPKPLTDDAVRAADYIITMGCGDVCPVYPGRHYRDWDLEDPVGKPLATVRTIRDDIERRVRELLTEILG